MFRGESIGELELSIEEEPEETEESRGVNTFVADGEPVAGDLAMKHIGL